MEKQYHYLGNISETRPGGLDLGDVLHLAANGKLHLYFFERSSHEFESRAGYIELSNACIRIPKYIATKLEVDFSSTPEDKLRSEFLDKVEYVDAGFLDYRFCFPEGFKPTDWLKTKIESLPVLDGANNHFPLRFKINNLICFDEDLPKSSTVSSDYEYLPEDLQTVIEAWKLFWKGAKQKRPETHPKKDEDIKWLKDRGLSDAVARRAATIIRPDWKRKGGAPKTPT